MVNKLGHRWRWCPQVLFAGGELCSHQHRRRPLPHSKVPEKQLSQHMLCSHTGRWAFLNTLCIAMVILVHCELWPEIGETCLWQQAMETEVLRGGKLTLYSIWTQPPTPCHHAWGFATAQVMSVTWDVLATSAVSTRRMHQQCVLMTRLLVSLASYHCKSCRLHLSA